MWLGEAVGGAMRYDTRALYLKPELYVPMDDRSNGIPKEIFGRAVFSYFGSSPVQYEKFNETLGEAILLGEGEYFTLSVDEDFAPEECTISMWVKFTGNSGIFHFRSEGDGIGINFDSGQVNIISGESVESVLINVLPDVLHLVSITYDGTSVTIYVDGSQVFTTTDCEIPETDTLFFGSDIDGSGAGVTRFNNVMYIPRRLSDQEISDNYSIGFFGRIIRLVDSDSSININFSNTNHLQTSWQAYGIVTVKQ